MQKNVTKNLYHYNINNDHRNERNARNKNGHHMLSTSNQKMNRIKAGFNISP